MKTNTRLLFAALFGLFVLLALGHAQDAAAAAPSSALTADQLIQWLTPVLVPLILAGFKKLSPSLPAWSLPLLAPVLGMLIDLVNSFASSHASNLWLAAGLGLAGVGLREMKEAVKPAPNGGWPTPTNG